MEIKILQNEKNTLEFEIVGANASLAEFIVQRLLENKEIEFAAYNVEHPLISNPKIIVRTSKKNALEETVSVLEKIKNEVKEFRELFVSSLKKKS